MWFLRTWRFLLALGLIVLAAFGYHRRDAIEPWVARLRAAIEPAQIPSTEPDKHDHDHDHDHDRIVLSDRAKRNLRLKYAPAKLQTRWSTVEMPGMVVERFGQSGRGISAVAAGVVLRIHALPGDRIRPGEPLFSLRIVSEPMQAVQAALFRTARELEINAEEQERLASTPDGESLFRGRLWELRYERRRQQAAMEAHRHDLIARGLSAEQVGRIAAGQFVTDLEIKAPTEELPSRAGTYEIEELRVQPGELVQAGQLLCTLSAHDRLDVEGRAVESEAGLVRQCFDENRPIEIIVVESSVAPEETPTASIRYVANHVDHQTRTLPFFLGLANVYRAVGGDGGKGAWVYRPGQRVRLRVPVEKYEGVFVVPSDAIARERQWTAQGHSPAEAYLFRVNGEALERRTVHVLYSDEIWAYVANDGAVAEGNVLVQNAGAALLRILKTKDQKEEGHGHDHDHGH